MTTTYTYRCRCGEKSPGFASKRESLDWHARHRRECVRKEVDRKPSQLVRADPREGLDGRSVRTTDNCLHTCLATLFDCDPDRVPRPRSYFIPGAGFDLYGYDEALGKATGYRFRNLGVRVPRDSRNWIAVMQTSTTHEDGETHAILCRGRQLLFDPGDVFKAFQPSMLEFGLELVEA